MSIFLAMLMICVLVACLFGTKKYKVLMAAALLLFQLNILVVSFNAEAREIKDKSACAIGVDNAIREYGEAISIYLLYLFVSSVGFFVLVSSKSSKNIMKMNVQSPAGTD